MRFSIFLAVLSANLLACGGRNVAPPRAPGGESLAYEEREAPGYSAGASGEYEAPHTHTDEVNLESMQGELPPAAPLREPHPLAGLSNAEVEAILLKDAADLGPASLGKTNRGALFGGVQMQPGEGWHIVNSRETYGTQETIDYLSHTIHRVGEMFPETPDINVGDISRPKGGHFTPHLSHQSGRDVDLGFYYLDGSAWYSKANARNLDLPRNWALLKVTVTETDVEAVFLDRSLQAVLRSYATELGESEEWLDQVFGGPTSNLRPLVIHEEGHQTHFHIRYYNPIAQETGRRVYKALLKHKKIKPPTYYKNYKVKRGDSLNRIAKKFKTDVKTLRKANRLRSNRIYAGRTYKIPRKGGVVQPAKLVLPARRVPTHLVSPATASAIVSEADNEPASEQPQNGSVEEIDKTPVAPAN
ncbi:MAG: LysM peptidoglycan-binding domain-containing protein [Myxococcales bacterium]|nr:LysM peptidoglycan-binding domain-containing protein [Myxococcales bacterium]